MRKSSIYTFILLILLKIILEYSYIQFVSPIFSYQGFYINLNYFKMIESYLISCIIFLLIIYALNKYKFPSLIIPSVLIIFLFNPISSLFWLMDHERLYYYTIALNLMIIIFLVIKLPIFKFFSIVEGKSLGLIIMFIMSVIVYGSILFDGGLSRINLNLLEVYNTRADYIKNSNVLLSYLLTWQAHVINILLLAIALIKKRTKYILLLVFLQVFLFSMTGFRSFLFAPFVLIFLYILNSSKIKMNIIGFMALGTNLLLILVLVIEKITDNILWASIFIRRLFFIPANIHYVYYDFFKTKEKYNLSYSIFEGIVPKNYDLSPVKYISLNYFDRESGANVGIFGDAYLNFGLAGIFIFSLLLILIMKVLDSLSTQIPSFVGMSVLIIPSMSLVNSAFFTSLLTHGILFSILMIWLSNSIFKFNVGK